MAELIVGAILPVLFERLASTPVLDFVKRFKGIPSILKAWEKKLQMIQDVLVDAEEKQPANGAVKTWLDDLQVLAYDVEDLLDEFATRALELQLMAKDDDDHAKTSCCSSKVQNLIIPSCFTSLKFNRDVVSDIEDITSRLNELFERKKELELVKTSGGATSSSSISSTLKRPPTTCLTPVSDVVGRDEDKRRIIEMVLRGDSGNTLSSIQVISIVGMGGIGKTTLAQAVYNHASLEDKFVVKAWVCISHDFDVPRISKAILKDITGSSCDSLDFNNVQRQLQDHVTEKKFLIVLDDVWSADYSLWQDLKSPFKNAAQGSTIILTTRMENVATTLGSSEHLQLKPLPNDSCWNIFKNCVLEGKEANAYGNLEALYEKVVERCKGLPLAAQSLGALLRGKKRDQWDYILNNKIWEELEPNEGEKVLPVLRLSYQYLPLHLKRCFTYCAIFPQDYEFDEQELVLLWMAEGFLPKPKGNKRTEDLGHEFFRDLLSRSFFQQSKIDCSKYTMHDLINDLAKLVSGDACFMSKDTIGSTMKPDEIGRVRHFSFVSNHFDGEKRFEIIHKVKRLKSFLPFYVKGFHCYITNTVVSDWLPKMKRLRVLSLKGYYVTELPELIGDLRQLRYFNLALTMIKSLPESICRLLNLETLILRDCAALLKLPSGMANLINLRCLDIKGADLINEMPVGIENLKSLQILSDFVVGRDSCSTLSDLNKLKLLHGDLSISKLENANVMREYVLREKVGLKVLRLEWSGDSKDEEGSKKVLNVLEPHTNIEELTITSYDGKGFPYWVGIPSFTNIKILKLVNCKKCTSLPSLEQLSSLEKLTIDGLENLKIIGPEVCGHSLKTIKLERLPECEHWEPIRENEHVQKFIRLRKLSIRYCPKISGCFPHNLPSLEKLEVIECADLMVSLSNLQMVCYIEIYGCKKVVCSCSINSKLLKSLTLSYISELRNCLIQGIQRVGLLKIQSCEEIIFLWQQDQPAIERPLQGLHDLISLSELCIENCPNLVSIPEVCFLPTLAKLEIKNCNALTSLPEGIKHNLEFLEIEYCDSLKFIARGIISRSLRRLTLNRCTNLRDVFDDGEDGCKLPLSASSLSSFSSTKTHEEHIEDTTKSLLEYLCIKGCSSLKCLSPKGMLPPGLKHLEIWECSELTLLSSESQLPKALQRLDILYCEKLESIAKAFYDNISLELIRIWHCESLRSIPDGLHYLSRLQSISVIECPSLDSFPEEGLPNTVSEIEIVNCGKLQAIPNGIHLLSSLKKLRICGCPSIPSFPEEGFPSNLLELSVCGHLKIYKQMIQSLQNLTYLRNLFITGCKDALCFPEEETLPTSLVHLSLDNFPKLKYLSSSSIRNLVFLESMFIGNCPNLMSFPREGLPSSLSRLQIWNCPLLREGCKRGKGKEWQKISHIPCVDIDFRNVYSD